MRFNKEAVAPVIALMIILAIGVTSVGVVTYALTEKEETYVDVPITEEEEEQFEENSTSLLDTDELEDLQENFIDENGTLGNVTLGENVTIPENLTVDAFLAIDPLTYETASDEGIIYGVVEEHMAIIAVNTTTSQFVDFNEDITIETSNPEEVQFYTYNEITYEFLTYAEPYNTEITNGMMHLDYNYFGEDNFTMWINSTNVSSNISMVMSVEEPSVLYADLYETFIGGSVTDVAEVIDFEISPLVYEKSDILGYMYEESLWDFYVVIEVEHALPILIDSANESLDEFTTWDEVLYYEIILHSLNGSINVKVIDVDPSIETEARAFIDFMHEDEQIIQEVPLIIWDNSDSEPTQPDYIEVSIPKGAISTLGGTILLRDEVEIDYSEIFDVTDIEVASYYSIENVPEITSDNDLNTNESLIIGEISGFNVDAPSYLKSDIIVIDTTDYIEVTAHDHNINTAFFQGAEILTINTELGTEEFYGLGYIVGDYVYFEGTDGAVIDAFDFGETGKYYKVDSVLRGPFNYTLVDSVMDIADDERTIDSQINRGDVEAVEGERVLDTQFWLIQGSVIGFVVILIVASVVKYNKDKRTCDEGMLWDEMQKKCM